ncbi:coilin isoform X3 [Sesamum indicum]|uniref:Coilin isoform X3 n=1 Tax=Sesamum indicum TaxID=4182 RepID=A0A6I9TPV6_SESIN|nr:coilin isoform X3 [Sesamum indicum]
MEESKRIRLVFIDDDILSETQKSDGLSRSWVLLKPHQHASVSDVASHLLHAFQLHQSCPHGLLLSISSFVLPPFESTRILKDNEIVRVRKRRDILSIEGNDAANKVEKLEAAEKQPVNSGVLLLANKEFENEKGGYESDDPEGEFEEDDEEDLLEDMENPSGGNADPKNRKRKAPEKLQGSKTKKQCSEATGNVAKDVHKKKFENSCQDGEVTKKKCLSTKEKNDHSDEDDMENNAENANSSDKSHVSVPDMKRTDEVQEIGKETEGLKTPKETKKTPSRSARRKYAKRRWLREMAKIQKQNATCESEGLRNWKEDRAKAERNKVDGQLKGLQKWKRNQAAAESNEVDGQPKGLLHWKHSPQTNWFVKGKKRDKQNQKKYFHKHPNQNGDVHEQQNQSTDEHAQPTQNGDGHKQPNEKPGDVHKPPSQKDNGVQEHPSQNYDASELTNQESDEENEVVPIVIRPGHIRFEPLGKEQSDREIDVPSESFHWNGITSKKKGQKWGKENRSFTPRNDIQISNKEYTEILSNEEEAQPGEGVDFDKLPPLPSIPKEGDLIAYRVLELSSSWTPELSAYRVGKVSWYNSESNQTMLVPVPQYPIRSKSGDEDEVAQPDSSLYKEDGSLEIDFSSLIDVRILNVGNSASRNEALSQVSEGSAGNKNAPKAVLPSSNGQQIDIPSPDTTELNQGKETEPPSSVNIWDQISETLNAKKEELSKEKGWGTTPKKVQPSQENSWGKNAKKVQQSPESGWGKSAQKVQPPQDNSWGKNVEKVQPSPVSASGKNAQKIQPPQDNSWGKQSSGGKSWSYKALRGSALGPTVAILRSRKDI